MKLMLNSVKVYPVSIQVNVFYLYITFHKTLFQSSFTKHRACQMTNGRDVNGLLLAISVKKTALDKPSYTD